MIDKDVNDPNPKIDPAPNSNTEKEADDWVSGDDPMTGGGFVSQDTFRRMR